MWVKEHDSFSSILKWCATCKLFLKWDNSKNYKKRLAKGKKECYYNLRRKGNYKTISWLINKWSRKKLKLQKKMLTIDWTHDNINELRVKHGQHKSKELQSPSRNEVARWLLSQNNPLHEYDFLKASFRNRIHTNDCFARTLTNKQ